MYYNKGVGFFKRISILPGYIMSSIYLSLSGLAGDKYTLLGYLISSSTLIPSFLIAILLKIKEIDNLKSILKLAQIIFMLWMCFLGILSVFTFDIIWLRPFSFFELIFYSIITISLGFLYLRLLFQKFKICLKLSLYSPLIGTFFPLTEEIVFRGFFQPHMGHLISETLSIIIVSTVFMFNHISMQTSVFGIFTFDELFKEQHLLENLTLGAFAIFSLSILLSFVFKFMGVLMAFLIHSLYNINIFLTIRKVFRRSYS